jgi:uncharacterized protein (DUF433 family)
MARRVARRSSNVRRGAAGGVQTVSRDEKVMSGAPVFPGTRVLVQTLFDYLEAGDPVDRFLEHYPSVQREQAIAALEDAKRRLLEEQ